MKQRMTYLGCSAVLAALTFNALACSHNPKAARQDQMAIEDYPQITALEHLDRVVQGHPEHRAIGYFRKFLVFYARRHPKRRQMLGMLMKAKTRSEVEAGINAWYDAETLVSER